MEARRNLVLAERAGRVVTLTLDNPPRQFIDWKLIRELDEVLRALERDRTVGAIVLTSAHPRSFITHYSVGEILAGAEQTPDLRPAVYEGLLRVVAMIARLPRGPRLILRTPAAGMLVALRLQELYLRMNRMDKVIIAAINGHTAAGGAELALACDIRIMADGDFTIGMTEPVLGFNPGGGGGHRLVRAVGPARGVEMLLEARHYAPADAVEAGFVHRVVEPDRLMQEAHATAVRLARRSPRAIWAVKRDAYRGFSSRWPNGFRLARTGFIHGAVWWPTKRAMKVMLGQIESLPARETPSPWADEELRQQWQEGTVVDLTGSGAPGGSSKTDSP